MKKLFTWRSAYAGPAAGLLFNQHAVWLGVHDSQHTRRVCINIVPMLTVWVAFKGGTEP